MTLWETFPNGSSGRSSGSGALSLRNRRPSRGSHPSGVPARAGLIFGGTPLPFDPPRRLVIAGPYRSVRNPMAIGVGSALLGAALFYESVSLFVLAGLFMLGIHAFVVSYEEPTLRRMFGAEYAAYCARVNRWLPLRPVPRSESRDMVRFDVFGREIGILRSGDEWRAVYIGPDGKHRPANDVMIPSSLAGSELETYLADVFHESASPAHPNVTRLGL